MPKGLDGLKSPNNPHVSFYWDKPDYKEEEREGLYESSLSGVHRIRADSNRKMKSE